MIRVRLRHAVREVRATIRDTRLLFSRFRGPLILFIAIILGSGFFYRRLSLLAGEPVASLAESIYLVLSLTFLQPVGGFPRAWYLQVFFFLMPILGVGILAQGLADFGVLLFNRRARGKEWEMAVASTYNNHVIVVGLGHLGYRVVKKLSEMEQDVVIVDLETQPDLLYHTRQMGFPVIKDDASREVILESAGVRRARAVILCTQNDNLNLQIAVKSRSLNPDIQVVIRIFDDDFAQSLQKQFGFIALSATGMAAPVFAAVAANIDITPPITIEGQPNSLARFQITARSKLIGKMVNQVEDQYQISVVFLLHNGQQIMHPAGDLVLSAADTVAVLGSPENISNLVHQNRG